MEILSAAYLRTLKSTDIGGINVEPFGKRKYLEVIIGTVEGHCCL